MIIGNGSGGSRIDTYATDPAFEDLTVLILSRNRPQYLERQVRWWSQTNAQILIADGSTKPNKNVQKIAATQNKISYTNIESLAHRFLWAAQRLFTKFSLITADDDLHLFSGVSASLRSLIEYEEFGTCMGQTASFAINRMTFELRCDDAEGIGLNYNDRLSDIYNKKLTPCSPAERMLERAKPYGCFCFYGVQRTEISGLVWQLLARLGDPNTPPCDFSPYLLELTYELASTVFAPVSTIADLSYVTFGENLPIRFLEGPNDVLLHDWIYLEKSRTSLSCWLDKVSTFKPFHNFLGSEQEVTKKFLTAIELYSSQFLLSSKKQGILGILYKKITLKIRLTLKLFLRINALRRCREFFRMKGLKPLSKMITAEADSLGKGFDFKMRKVDIVELEEVSALIREFHTTV